MEESGRPVQVAMAWLTVDRRATGRFRARAAGLSLEHGSPVATDLTVEWVWKGARHGEPCKFKHGRWEDGAWRHEWRHGHHSTPEGERTVRDEIVVHSLVLGAALCDLGLDVHHENGRSVTKPAGLHRSAHAQQGRKKQADKRAAKDGQLEAARKAKRAKAKHA